MAIHQSRTTFFAPEGTWLDKLDSIHCVPSQLVVPLALKWMLVYEERDSSKLRLCGGIPLEWLKKGKPVSVKNAPVKGGKISFSVKKNPRKEELNLSVEFSEKNRTIPEEIIFHLNIADKKSGNDDSTLTIKTENRKKIDVSFPVTKI
jgi:hypothetical protein